MKEMLAQIVRNKKGQTLIEYVLILLGIALIAIAAIWALGSKLSNFYASARNIIPG
jgi:Flp pilus assembly pilin Flp